MFHHQRKGSLSAQGKSLKDLTRTVSAGVFLAEDRRQVLLKRLNGLSFLEQPRYESLCLCLVEHLVHYCQNLPETANSYYSQPGGLVDHALNRTEAALSLFQEFMLHDPVNSLSEEQKLWQYALYSAAILQGIGKLFVDYQVNFYEANGQFLKEWNPLLESMSANGIYYSYEFQKESEPRLRRCLNLLLAKILMPASGFAWIVSNSEVLAAWLALLNEDERWAGTLGAILIRADALAIQRYLLELMPRGTASQGGGRYRAATFAGGSVPENLLEKEQLLGVEFIQWLIHSLAEGRIMINKAPLFIVPGGMLMSQELFQLFVREHPEYKNWQLVQNGFLALGLHQSAVDGSIISRFREIRNQQIQAGILFAKYALVLPPSFKVHESSSGKVESLSAIELIHRAQQNSQFTQLQNPILSSLQKLNAAGQWLPIENQTSGLHPGAEHGA